MAKPQILTNKTELLGAIYNAETLATAVFVNRTEGCDSRASSAHGFRIGNESVLDQFLEGVKNKGDFGEPIKIEFYPFWEDIGGWKQHTDHATYWATNGDVSRDLKYVELYAEKAFEDCA